MINIEEEDIGTKKATDNKSSLRDEYTPQADLCKRIHASLRHKPSWLLSAWVGTLSVLLVFMSPTCHAFNVDIKSAVVHKGEKGSMFGYTVAQHIDQSTNWVLIGAPKAQTRQKGVTQGGAVLRCKAISNTRCQQVPFDTEGNNIMYHARDDKFKQSEEKSHQWLGATLHSSGENGVIVACAPRYTYFSSEFNKREPIGACYVAKSSTTKYERFRPCKEDRAAGIYGSFIFQGYCQAGASAALSRDGSRLMIGAPGSYYWQGQVFQVDASNVNKTLQYSEEGPTEDDYGYKGYASAIGEFDGEDGDEYVVGIPKGSNNSGMIEIYTQNMTVIFSLEGEQIGSYFGSVLEVMDLNGDRYDDIIIGAPFFADTKSDDYENGRVYIFYQTKNRKIRKKRKDILDGFSSQSRFGMALSRLGDINYDGYEDLCVGAPYAGEDRRGAIYLYHGSADGIITNPTQVIYAKDVDNPLSTFGISISGSLDQDSNGYPDLIVGAHASDKAVFFRSRPVVRTTASLVVQNLSNSTIDLKVRKCSTYEAKPVTCLTIHTCLSYSGYRLPDLLYYDVEWTLDAKVNGSGSQEQRAYFADGVNMFKTKKVIAVTKVLECSTIRGHVKHDIVDKLSPIKILLEFKLSESRYVPMGGNNLLPILDAHTPTWTTFTAEIKNDCGTDKVCIPDLSIFAIRTGGAHVIGKRNNLEIVINIENRGEDSFNTKIWIDLPPGVVYDTITEQTSDVPISCGTLESNNKIVVCDVGNPMKKDTESRFTLSVTPTNANDTQDQMIFALQANSSNPEKDYEAYNDNYESVLIPVTADPQIYLDANANPEIIVLNTTQRSEDGNGRLVKHEFQLGNQGSSAIKETMLQVLWPSKDRRGSAVLTIDGPLVLRGNGKCNITTITPENAWSFGSLWWQQESKDTKRSDGTLLNQPGSRGVRIDCSSTGDYCTVIQCVVGYLAPFKTFGLTILSRLKPNNFLKKREISEKYQIASVAEAKVLSVPYDFKSVDASKFQSVRQEATTVIHTDQLKPAGEGVKIWVIALAITCGILLLILLILLLWFCGFFKRMKPKEEGYFTVTNGNSYIDNKVVD